MLLNHNAGFDYVKKLIGSKFQITMVTPWNRGRHLLVQVKDGNLYKYFYCLFKHTQFHSFNYVFKDFVNKFPEFAGYGESINTDFLMYARNRDATLLYIYPDGKVYCVESHAVFKFCNNNGLSRVQDRNNEYLEKYTSHVQIVQEREYVFPIKLMARWY